jgi:hypothetical protein
MVSLSSGPSMVYFVLVFTKYAKSVQNSTIHPCFEGPVTIRLSCTIMFKRTFSLSGKLKWALGLKGEVDEYLK